MTTTTANLSSTAAPTTIATGTVTSKDGTTIGYRQVGGGPGVVLVHGAMESGQSHLQLAQALAEAFTVTMLDRRGRGLSGPYGPAYGVHKDVEDLEAVLTKTRAHRVFWVSSGAVIAPQPALPPPPLPKDPLFDPPL